MTVAAMDTQQWRQELKQIVRSDAYTYARGIGVHQPGAQAAADHAVQRAEDLRALIAEHAAD